MTLLQSVIALVLTTYWT